MSGAKDAEEAQIVDRLVGTPLDAIDTVGRQALGGESGGAGIRDGVGGGEAAEPVADPVGVAGPEDDADAALDDGGEGGEEVAGVVAGGGELVVGRVGALGVGGLGADGARDGGLEQVAGVGGGRVGVVARLADVVDVEVVEGDAAVGRGGAEGPLDVAVAGVVGVLAGGVGARGGGAFGQERGAALGVGGGELRVLGRGDDGLVRVVVGEVDVGLLLDGGVVPAVVDAQGDEVDVVALDAPGFDGRVLGLEVGGELTPVVTAIALGEEPEGSVLVLGELCVEGLQQCPDVGGGGDGARDGVGSVGEPRADGLINVQHISVGVEAERIKRWRGSSIDEMAGSILLYRLHES